MPRKYRLQAVSIVLALAVLGCEQSVTDVVDWTAEANHPSITALLSPLATGTGFIDATFATDFNPVDGDYLSGLITVGGTFTVAAGDVVYVDGSVEIVAADVLIAGTLDASGAGPAGGAVPSLLAAGKPGFGTGGGAGSASNFFEGPGGGGGGYGGAGGGGGTTPSTGAQAAGGASYGATNPPGILMGSGGGSASSNFFNPGGAGGDGGGAITIVATDISVTGIGVISVSGADGLGSTGGGLPVGGGGGGSGGGIWLDGALDISGSLLAVGGVGGPVTSNQPGVATAGGGGGGGRIKLSGCGVIDAGAIVLSTGGSPGGNSVGNGVSLPQPGADGTTPTDQDDPLEACGTTSTSASFLIIDEESIGKGSPPHSFDEMDVSEHIADIGVRTQLPFFESNVGSTITLHTGEVGDEGWFALKTIPDSWNAAGPTPDGLRNYVGNPVGPGLGSGGDPEALLDKIPNVTPLRAMGLKQLVGQRVCAVVYKSDVSINYDPLDGSLKGDNLGTVAFEVLSVTRLDGFSSSSLPQAEIEILDANDVCEGSLTLFTDAPEPISSSEPFDVDPS